MKYEMMDDTLQLFLEGHIDSNNAEQTEKEINDIIAQNSCQNILIDAEGLEYISSAGLRVLLRLRKKFPKMEVVNVRPDVLVEILHLICVRIPAAVRGNQTVAVKVLVRCGIAAFISGRWETISSRTSWRSVS